MSPKHVNCYNFLGQFNYFGPDDYDPNIPILLKEKQLPIRVVEATYGGNFISSQTSIPQGNIPLCHGNVTEIISEIINKNYTIKVGATLDIDVDILQALIS